MPFCVSQACPEYAQYVGLAQREWYAWSHDRGQQALCPREFVSYGACSLLPVIRLVYQLPCGPEGFLSSPSPAGVTLLWRSVYYFGPGTKTCAVIRAVPAQVDVSSCRRRSLARRATPPERAMRLKMVLASVPAERRKTSSPARPRPPWSLPQPCSVSGARAIPAGSRLFRELFVTVPDACMQSPTRAAQKCAIGSIRSSPCLNRNNRGGSPRGRSRRHRPTGRCHEQLALAQPVAISTSSYGNSQPIVAPSAISFAADNGQALPSKARDTAVQTTGEISPISAVESTLPPRPSLSS